MERCHNLCKTYCLDPDNCDACSGFMLGFLGNADGRCALYKEGCLKDETNVNSNHKWTYYDMDECSYSGNII